MAIRLARAPLAIAIALVQLTAACGGGGQTPSPTPFGPTPTPGPTPTTHTLAPSAKVVKVLDAVPAGCALLQAWAGLSPIPELTDCTQPVSNWNPIPNGSLVTTSACGQAWLDTECGKLYVFQNSGLQLSTCDSQSSATGSGCVSFGSVAWGESGCSSEAAIATASGTIRLIGTWVSATYVEERQLTLFAVFEGKGEVTPVLDRAGRTVGQPQTIEAGNFWFTVPGDQPSDVAGLQARVAHPFARLPDIVHELDLETWFAAITERARADNIDTSGIPAMPVVNVRVAGGSLDRRDLQDAVLLAFDWAAEAKARFPDGDVAVVGLAGRDPPRDLLAQVQNFDEASKLVKIANLDDRRLTVIVEESNELPSFGKDYIPWLSEIGLEPEFTVVPSEVAAGIFNRVVADGGAAIWLATN